MMELVSVISIVNGDIGEIYLALESLTDRGTILVFSSVHLPCTSFGKDLLIASSSVIPVALVTILVFKAPLVSPRNSAAFSSKEYFFLGLIVLAAYCFMLIDEKLW